MRMDAEVLEKFRVNEGRWVVLCFHNPAYGVWNMDQDGFCTLGEFATSLEEGNFIYQERVSTLFERTREALHASEPLLLVR
jgi:hypothetical protein